MIRLYHGSNMLRKKDRSCSVAGGGLIMTREGDFVAYCADIYRMSKGISGKEVSQLFTKYGVWDYLWECFGALHTTGTNYIVNDIDEFITERS